MIKQSMETNMAELESGAHMSGAVLRLDIIEPLITVVT
jgi:hypothetical protein